MEDVCDRVAILYGGRLRACGTIGELLHEKNLVQITAEMDEATVGEVTTLIRKRRGEGARIDVSPPMQRLENFFLRVVDDARAQRMETSGVDQSSGEFDFMTSAGEQGSDLIRKLARADEDDARVDLQIEHDSRLVTSEPADRKQVLESLVRAEDEAGQPSPAAPSRIQQHEPEANRGLLDKLVDGDKD